ncbi:band 4.1-like protein 2 isoform X7 [Entelurus aequoreus]|uniref:band 4.1-like protein 2 isoform X7 n=1 Tax=Entelurus aequoreus TaxID=161455 RepID=UPI002B1E8259|nr:band 4.1-like protein 2 isoform X7 [Entelurus aequoreus]
MTTEAGSETEVKENAEEKSAARLDQSKKATEKTQEVVEEGEAEKEKEGKGITRYLPTWFKKQKSQSQTSPTKEDPPTEEPVSKVNQEEAHVPEVNGHAEEVEEKEQVKEKESESHSNASADTEPAGEEKVEESAQKSLESTEETQEVAEKEEDKKEVEKDRRQGQTSIFQSPLRLVRKNKMKLVVCHVTLLDGSDFTCEVEKRAKGLFLFFKVCEHLNLLEKDYFGLTYKDHHEQKCWLDPTKEIKRQIRSNNWQFAFNVKFYPPDPSLLSEDITRYLLCLQLREDVASGRLPCSFVTHALLGSYTLQAEIGDYEPDQPRPLDYINQLTFAPNQSKEMEEKILELHKSHKGMTPAQADCQFLENAKKLSMYGVDLHHAKDCEGVDIMLGVCANGLLVYKDRLRINRFAWPKILKISYKRNNFYIKIRPGETEQFESTVGFKLQNHRSAKRLWKVCVENHSFFRLNAPEQPPKARFLTLGSKFRYSGRTQNQTRMASTLIDRPAPAFERTSSKRISRSLDGAPMISITDTSREAENGHEPHLELHSDSKSPGRVRGDNIYVRHSKLMLEDHDKTQDEVLKHQASVSELKRSFMEASPPSPPQLNLWEKHLTSSPATATRVQQQTVVLEEEAAGTADNCDAKEPSKTTEVEIEETVVVQEISKAAKPAEELQTWEGQVQGGARLEKKRESISSESESDEEAEYHPNVSLSIRHAQIPEEKEEEEEEQERKELSASSSPVEVNQAAAAVEDEGKDCAEEEKKEVGAEEPMKTPDKAPNGMTPHEEVMCVTTEEEELPKVNGEDSVVEARSQVICCSELDGSGDGEPGVLMTAQTITSESLCTTTTTHITKTLKGGLSETRIEKRIVITGDCDIDHDQALAQAIKEAKEQHPDMSVTRVVVHKETELAEEDD